MFDPSDVGEATAFETLQREQDPYIVVVSLPSETLAYLNPHIPGHGQVEAVRSQTLGAVEVYRNQMKNRRFFLHDAVHDSDTWMLPEM